MIYDPVRDRLIVHGGRTRAYYYEAGIAYRNDTWALNLTGPPVWIPLATPARLRHRAAATP